MKKTILLTAVAALAMANANAQTPKKENVSVIVKSSATWCGPCGDWGWTISNNLISQNPNAIYMGVFPSTSDGGTTSGTWQNLQFNNNTAVKMSSSLNLTSGYPSFSANFFNYNPMHTSSSGGIYTGPLTNSVDSAAKKFMASTDVVASTGFTYTIKGNVITINTKTKFWKAANGTYNVAVYLLEDGALNRQNAQTDPAKPTDVTAHHGVLRGAISADMGDQIATGAIAANAEFSKNFSYTVTNTKWDKNKFHPVVVLYKVTGSKYEFVNANKNYEILWPANVAEVSDMANVVVYPNPASNYATVSMALKNASDVNIMVTDAIGRTVYQSGNIHFNAGEIEHTIATSNLAAGLYHVNIVANGNPSTHRLSIVK